MSKKLTPWFPPEMKPVRVGIYETDAETEGGTSCYQSWNGAQWSWCSSDSDFTVIDSRSIHQSPRWRGLAVKP